MDENFKVCVYCSSSNALEKNYYDQARLLGRTIAQEGWSLVYGGTHIGLMGEVANTALEGKAGVIGVIPQHIHNRGLGHSGCTQLIVTPDMSERKKTMIGLGDAFIALPGGFGTLEEVVEVITLKQLQLLNKPIVFLNTQGFYNGLGNFFESFFHKGFTAEKFRQLYFMADDIAQAVDYIRSYQPLNLTDKWSA